MVLPLPPDDRDPPDEPDRPPDDRAGVDGLRDGELRLTLDRDDRFVEVLLLVDRDEDRFDVLSRLAGLSTDRDDFPESDRRIVLLFVDLRWELGRFTLLSASRFRVARCVPRWMVRPELSFLGRV